MTAEGIPPPGSGRGPGRGWWQETIRHILINRAYIGELKYQGVVINLPELAIIAPEYLAETEKRSRANRERAKRHRKHDYLLSGHLRCMCGAAVVGRTTNRWLNYCCSVGASSSRRHLYPCREKPISAGKLEGVVWAWIESLLNDDENIEQGLTRMVERSEAEARPNRERVALISEIIDREERKIKRLAHDLAEMESEQGRAAIKAEMQNISKQVAALSAERDTLAASVAQRDLPPELRQTVKETATQIRVHLVEATLEQKRQLMDLLNVQLKLFRDDLGRWLEATCSLALETGRLSIESQGPMI